MSTVKLTTVSPVCRVGGLLERCETSNLTVGFAANVRQDDQSKSARHGGSSTRNMSKRLADSIKTRY